ncbi:atrial natriuretic peptide receptor 3-like [Saccostrea cucullata]|uniref:atrial natriuretic peptide receptor 3-like n=1 Tax=Saccostrea cuccullata TaxID=36930 RepID=UPI002ECFE911
MLLLCILTFVFSSVSSETEVQMAVLLPNDSYRLFSDDKLLPAIEIGIERVQKALVPDVKFNVSYADTKCHIGIAMNEAIKFRYSGTVHAFFGPVCDYAVAPVARQSKFWNIPVISVGAMASEFHDFRKKDYPYLIRAGPVNFNNVAEYFKHMFDYYSWRKFKIIYERNGQDVVFEDFCHIMSVAIYYNLKADSSNTTSDYFKLDPQVDLGNLLVTETGHSYGGKTTLNFFSTLS